VQTRQTRSAITIPSGSVTKNSSGDVTVWVHVAAERFAPKKVQIQALDANTVAVIAGLHEGDRVVTQGAASLSQIR
ncbi:MAG: HlyD family secretion protein, partial [Sulfuriferula sp.]